MIDSRLKRPKTIARKQGKHERVRKLLNNLLAHEPWLSTDLTQVLGAEAEAGRSLEFRQPVRSVDDPEAGL
jgi:hypothetical protein